MRVSIIKDPVFPGSSAVEPPAVNRAVASSNLALGAIILHFGAYGCAEIPRTDVAAGGVLDFTVLIYTDGSRWRRRFKAPTRRGCFGNSVVECLVHIEEVGGSSPSRSTMKYGPQGLGNGVVAQLGERRVRNAEAKGSIAPNSTIEFNTFRGCTPALKSPYRKGNAGGGHRLAAIERGSIPRTLHQGIQ